MSTLRNRSFLSISTLISVAFLSRETAALAVELPSSVSQVILQTSYPGETTFTLPAGGSIVFSDTPVIGDNSQNWVFTNSGTLSATTVSTASGLQLDSKDHGAATIINYGMLQTAGTTASNAAGLRLMNGGNVINQPGATIEGYDGIHSVIGMVQLENHGVIDGIGASSVFTNGGLNVINHIDGTLLAATFGTRCYDSTECTLVNSGTISAGSIAVDFEGSGAYSMLNNASGVITAGDHAVLFESSNGQFINYGVLQSTNAGSSAVNSNSDNGVYVNSGTITGGGDTGTAMLVTGSGNTIYNLGTLAGSATALSLTGDDNLLVLGTHASLPALNIDVTGPGSTTTGAIVASGTGNRILLTDTGSEDTPFTGFMSLAMAGSSWQLDNSFTLNGTAPDTISVQSGRLVMTGNVATDGGVTIAAGGTLMIGNDANRAALLAALSGAIVQTGGTLGGSGLFVGDVANNGQIITTAALSGTQSVFTIKGNVTNSGLLNLTGGKPGNALAIYGNLISNGGRMTISTMFGGDGSATDRLVLIGGTTTGTTSVIVQSAGAGSGALTASGIRVVQTQNGATTTANAFALDLASSGYRAGFGSLSIGAFDYFLIRSGMGGNTNDWYLTSELAPTPDDGGNGGGSGGKGRTVRLYRPEAGLYVANQAAARTMFSMTLRDREGYSFYDSGKATPNYAGWARITGGQTYGRVEQDSLGIDANSASALFGADLLAAESTRYGAFRAGLMGGFGKAQTSADSRILANYRASGDVDGYSVGFYGTWWQNGTRQPGAYADAWAQYSWFDNKVRGGGLPNDAYHSNAVSASLEIGYSFDLGHIRSWQFMIEPQAQAIYSNLSFNRLIEQSGTLIRFRNDDGFAGRIGARMLGRYNLLDNRAVTVYLETNWWLLQNNGGLIMNNDIVRPDMPRSFAEVKVGVQGEITKNWMAWGQILSQAGQNSFHQIGGQIGVKYTW